MAVVLHKIVSAIRVPDNVLSGVAKIEKYALTATSTSLAVREVVHIDGVMRMNGKPTRLIGNQLAMGFTNSLRDVYKIESIPHSLELRAVEDVKLRPSFDVGENIRFTENKFTPELNPKLDKEAKTLMSSTDLSDEITPKIVERNPALKNIFNNMSGKTMKTVGGALVTIGVGIAAVCVAVNEHRNRLTACMLYYYEKDQLRRCTIATCTCKKISCKKDCNYCTNSILKKFLPADMLVDNCGEFKGTAGCVKCPSDDYNKANLSDDATLVEDSAADSSFVRCQRPNFFETLTDLFGGVSNDLLQIVHQSLNGLSWLVQRLPMIILFIFIGIVAIVAISFIGKLFRDSNNGSNFIQIPSEKET